MMKLKIVCTIIGETLIMKEVFITHVYTHHNFDDYLLCSYVCLQISYLISHVLSLFSSESRPFRLGGGANMERVVRMDREMTKVKAILSFMLPALSKVT